MKYFSKVEIDENGDYVILLPDEMLKELNWNIGDELNLEETLVCEENGEFQGIVLRKKDE